MDFGSARGDVEIPVSDPDAFNDATLDHVLEESDFVLLKNMGAHTVRLSLNTYKDFEDDDNPYTYREDNFLKLDKIISWAEKYEIYVILSMRQSPGGHNTSPHSGHNGDNELWKNAEYQNRLAALWKEIAGRYKNKEIIIGYDLLNEPEADPVSDLNDVYARIVQAIRLVDKHHIIFLEGNNFATEFAGLDITLDANSALSAHFYWPGDYAVEGIGTYPSVADGFTYESLENKIMERIGFAVNNNIPLWMGEFGAMSCAGNYLDYDQDVVTLFEAHGLSWNYWHFKNIKGVTNTQALYFMNGDNIFLRLLQGEDVAESDALEALKTEYFIERSELKAFLEDNY